METVNYVTLGLLAVMFIAFCGYELFKSQKDSVPLVSPLCKLTVVLECHNGNSRVDNLSIVDQDHAQQVLNEYMFHMIKSAKVTDPLTGEVLARMDKNGRLKGV